MSAACRQWTVWLPGTRRQTTRRSTRQPTVERRGSIANFRLIRRRSVLKEQHALSRTTASSLVAISRRPDRQRVSFLTAQMVARAGRTNHSRPTLQM